MAVPFSTIIIKSFSVGRGDAPNILEDLLSHLPISLRMFRSWRICDNSIHALSKVVGLDDTPLDYETEKISALRPVHSWCCVFTHMDRETDPTDLINDFCGPVDAKVWVHGSLRHTYGLKSLNPADNVIHVSTPQRAEYEAKILFMNFDKEAI